jgi:hypothetical protein
MDWDGKEKGKGSRQDVVTSQESRRTAPASLAEKFRAKEDEAPGPRE